MMSTADATPENLTRAPSKAFVTNLGRICGAVGLVLWVSTPLTFLLTAELGALVIGKLVFGALLIGLYLFTNADFFARVAGSRSTGLFAISSTSVLLVLGLVGFANYLAFKHPKEYDLTKEGLYTLSEQTTGLLKRLTTDVQVLAFYASYDSGFPAVEDALQRYKDHGTHLSYTMVDPQSRPDLVEKYQITERGPRIVVTARGQDARAKDASEQELTNAIVKVAEQTSKKVVFLVGHGEGNTADGEHAEGYKILADAVGAEGYAIDTLNLQEGQESAKGDTLNIKTDKPADAKLQVPADVSAVIVLASQKPLLAPEAAALEDYVNKGGRLMVMLEPHTKSGLETLMKQWKIDARQDIIVDNNPLNRLLGLGAAAPMVQPVPNDHPIIRDLTTAAVMMTARSLEVTNGGEAGVDAQPILRTGDTAWGETQVSDDGTAARDDKDNLPPLFTAVAAQKTVVGGKDGEKGRLVVFGDADFINNRYLPMQGNQDLVLNAINWLAEQEEKITIRPKARAGSQLFLSGEQLGKLKFLSMDILPVLLVAMGLGIVLVRRQR